MTVKLKRIHYLFNVKDWPHTKGRLIQKMQQLLSMARRMPLLILPVVHFSPAGLRSGLCVRWGRRILWQHVLWQKNFGKELCAGWRILLFLFWNYCRYSCLCFEWYLFSLTSPPMTSSRVEFRVFARQLKLSINNSERPVDALAEKHQLLTDWQLGIMRC